VVLFVGSFFVPRSNIIPRMLLVVLILLVLIDIIVLYVRRDGFFARRTMAERMSNGDDNSFSIYIENRYSFPVKIGVIDEIPAQFQKRDLWFEAALKSGEQKLIRYFLRPVKRGEYHFGDINVFVRSPIGFIQRRYKIKAAQMVPVYPSYLQMRKYQLMAISNRLSEIGVKKIRRLGHSMEFEQIKEYVQGDDYRTINWKATARKGQLMVNNFTDEKSQQIYCIINKGRVMKMPFEGLSLLDYAINASLVLSNVALLKHDKAGLLTYTDQIGSFLPADKRATQMNSILEVLYNQDTNYAESDFEKLYTHIRSHISQRSLVVLFTNFETLSSLQRELPSLRKIARHHLLLVVFFENTELRNLLDNDPVNIEGIYTKTIAEKFAYEKRLIVKELKKHGILSILTAPQNLTVNAVNKYLELKNRQVM
jgi:uncharacterized protein (DUF58 family)